MFSGIRPNRLQTIFQSIKLCYWIVELLLLLFPFQKLSLLDIMDTTNQPCLLTLLILKHRAIQIDPSIFLAAIRPHTKLQIKLMLCSPDFAANTFSV